MAQTRPLASRAADAAVGFLAWAWDSAESFGMHSSAEVAQTSFEAIKVGEMAGTQGEADTRVVPHATYPPVLAGWQEHARRTDVDSSSRLLDMRASNIRCITVSWPGAEGGVRDK
jgi:hypothetical protein